MKLTKNIMGAAGIGIVAIVYTLDALTLPMGTLRAPNMGFVPLIIGIGMIVGCVMLIVTDRLVSDKSEEAVVFSEEEEEEPEGESTGYKKPGIIAGSLLVYPIVFTTFGFIISTILLLYIALRVMEYKTWRVSLLTSVISVLVTYAIFAGLLGVYFPNDIFDWR
jgi:hypothetical protein